MNIRVIHSLILLFGLSLCGVALSATEPDKEKGSGRKVDEPLPETYEPLMGSPRNDEDFSRELKELRQLKEEQQKEKNLKEEIPVASPKPPAKNYPIQEPKPDAPPAAPTGTPPVEEQGDQLRIRDR
ncbi:MAG: hypothetical protein ACRETN_11790 [Nevskiales bacterium]